MDDQNDHCIVTWLGENWFINAMRPGMLFVSHLDDSHITTIIDISQCDWPSYCASAVDMIQKKNPSQ